MSKTIILRWSAPTVSHFERALTPDDIEHLRNLLTDTYDPDVLAHAGLPALASMANQTEHGSDLFDELLSELEIDTEPEDEPGGDRTAHPDGFASVADPTGRDIIDGMNMSRLHDQAHDWLDGRLGVNAYANQDRGARSALMYELNSYVARHGSATTADLIAAFVSVGNGSTRLEQIQGAFPGPPVPAAPDNVAGDPASSEELNRLLDSIEATDA